MQDKNLILFNDLFCLHTSALHLVSAHSYLTHILAMPNISNFAENMVMPFVLSHSLY